jgi:hypothetical protein
VKPVFDGMDNVTAQVVCDYLAVACDHLAQQLAMHPDLGAELDGSRNALTALYTLRGELGFNAGEVAASVGIPEQAEAAE